jgi:hypothetical protein
VKTKKKNKTRQGLGKATATPIVASNLAPSFSASPVFQSTHPKLYKDGKDELKTPHDSRLIKGGFKSIVGIKDEELSHQILSAGTMALSSCIGEEHALNATLQSLNDLLPADSIEARLATQANVVFTQAMLHMAKAQRMTEISHYESYMNLSIKLMKVHNETIETLSRYRRGGEQKVTVTHAVLANNAVVNNFTGGGDISKKAGDSPCQQYAEQKQEPMAINLADSQQCLTEGVGFMEEKARGQKQKKDVDA